MNRATKIQDLISDLEKAAADAGKAPHTPEGSRVKKSLVEKTCNAAGLRSIDNLEQCSNIANSEFELCDQLKAKAGRLAKMKAGDAGATQFLARTQLGT